MNSEQQKGKDQLLAERLKVEKELTQAQVVASTTAKELQDIRDKQRSAEKRLQSLREAVANLKGPAEVVLLSEYEKMKELIADNEGILALYKSQSEASKLKGTTAAKRAEDLASKLATVDKELSAHGKILPFSHARAPAGDEDQEPDDDDE